jgi:hypothetical protein
MISSYLRLRSSGKGLRPSVRPTMRNAALRMPGSRCLAIATSKEAIGADVSDTRTVKTRPVHVEKHDCDGDDGCGVE